MKLWIPKCGDALAITEIAQVSISFERRNAALWEHITGEEYKVLHYSDPAFHTQLHDRAAKLALLPGVELVVDRVYIRQTADEFASVTFVVKDVKDEKQEWLVGQRFWLSLEDVNTLNVVPTTTGNPVGLSSGKTFKVQYDSRKSPSPVRELKRQREKKSRDELKLCKEWIAEWNFRCYESDDALKLRTYLSNKAPPSTWMNQACYKDKWVATAYIPRGDEVDGVTYRNFMYKYTNYPSLQTSPVVFRIGTADNKIVSVDVMIDHTWKKLPL